MLTCWQQRTAADSANVHPVHYSIMATGAVRVGRTVHESAVDSPRTDRKVSRLDEYKALARYCIDCKLKTHPRQPQLQAGTRPPLASCSVEQIARHLQRVTAEVESRYGAQFRDMCSNLRLTTTTAYPTFASVAQGIFSSGVNWGRIAALYAFGSSLAWSMTDRGLFCLVGRVADWVAQFTDQKLGEWIANRGGWVRKLSHMHDWPTQACLRDCITRQIGPFKDRHIPTHKYSGQTGLESACPFRKDLLNTSVGKVRRSLMKISKDQT